MLVSSAHHITFAERPAPQSDVSRASIIGQWSPVSSWPVVSIHAHLLPDGKVLTWQRLDSQLTTQTYLWNPADNTFEQVFNPFTHLFCSGHSFLPDGKLLVTGGHHFIDGAGEPHTNIFDYQTKTWTRVADMNAGRWYPTNTTLANGEALVVSGTDL
ncbi:MAG TPA: galactose oxidase, partial [Blastocatellia bacterium]|nr:galactose oxidase [Blastocatellia bacterium]